MSRLNVFNCFFLFICLSLSPFLHAATPMLGIISLIRTYLLDGLISPFFPIFTVVCVCMSVYDLCNAITSANDRNKGFEY